MEKDVDAMVFKHSIAGHVRQVARAVTALSVTALLMRPALAAESGTKEAAPELTPAGETFIIGNVTFALLHEFGHAIIRDFKVPLLGLEEESADTLAAVWLILLDREQPETGFGEAVGVTALAQELVWDSGLERKSAEVTLWAQHGLSAQRFARLVCLLYGSDPSRYGWAAEAAEMEEIRAEGCVDEWRIAERATLWVRDTYGIAPSERSKRTATPISVKYAEPLDAQETRLSQLIRERQLLERIAAFVSTRFAFEPLSLKLSRCPVPNAYWDDEYREVVLCYELIQAFAKIAEHPEVAKVVERFRSLRKSTVPGA